MSKPPGRAGLPIVGDKSVDFYKDAIGFVQRKIEQHDSRIFCTRFLNQHTIFVASNAGVRELLDDESSNFDMGYKQFMAGIYGDNVIFMDGEEAQYTRSVLQKILLRDDTINSFQRTTDRLTNEAFKSLELRDIPIYPCLKKLATEICLSMFLDISFETSRSLAEDIISLTTTHWHGIISVPLNLKLPGTSQKSTYGRALEAKDKLLSIIESKLSDSSVSNGFTTLMRESDFPRAQLANNHVLLFTSALVPKAIASILTSFILVTSNRRDLVAACREDEGSLERVLLETQRMWPPFIGGRRIAKQACQLQGLDVDKDHALVFMTYHAQRDPLVFTAPDDFLPDRWRDRNANDRDKLILFGGGSRCCLGQHLVQYLLKRVATALLERYDWSLPEGEELEYKWLPVSRPKSDVHVKFIPRHAEF